MKEISEETKAFLGFFNFFDVVQFSGIVKTPDGNVFNAWYVRFFKKDATHFRALTFFLGFKDSDKIPELEPSVHYDENLEEVKR